MALQRPPKQMMLLSMLRMQWQPRWRQQQRLQRQQLVEMGQRRPPLRRRLRPPPPGMPRTQLRRQSQRLPMQHRQLLLATKAPLQLPQHPLLHRQPQRPGTSMLHRRQLLLLRHQPMLAGAMAWPLPPLRGLSGMQKVRWPRRLSMRLPLPLQMQQATVPQLPQQRLQPLPLLRTLKKLLQNR